MAEAVKKPRPEFRNIGIGQILTAYRLPLAGRVSILHRLSGGLLFVALPFLLYLFDQSLTSELSFEVFKGFSPTSSSSSSRWCSRGPTCSISAPAFATC